MICDKCGRELILDREIEILRKRVEELELETVATIYPYTGTAYPYTGTTMPMPYKWGNIRYR